MGVRGFSPPDQTLEAVSRRGDQTPVNSYCPSLNAGDPTGHPAPDQLLSLFSPTDLSILLEKQR